MMVYDIVMLLMILFGGFWGARRGLTVQLATLASLALGYFVAYPLSAAYAHKIPVASPSAARGLALLLGYIGISGAVFLLAAAVRMTLKRYRMEEFDKHLGMVVGGVAGMSVGLLLTLCAVGLLPNLRDPILNSPSGHIAVQFLTAIEPEVPESLRPALEPLTGPDADFDSGAPKVTGVGAGVKKNPPSGYGTGTGTGYAPQGNPGRTPPPPPQRPGANRVGGSGTAGYGRDYDPQARTTGSGRNPAAAGQGQGQTQGQGAGAPFIDPRNALDREDLLRLGAGLLLEQLERSQRDGRAVSNVPDNAQPKPR